MVESTTEPYFTTVRSTNDLTNRNVEQDPISDLARTIIGWATNYVLSIGVSLFGIVTNCINIIIFQRQGFSDGANVSLLGLTVADIGGLVCLLWLNVCGHPFLIKSGKMPYITHEIQYITAGIPRSYFSKLSCWMTIFITVQRCLSVALPLQVKTLLSPVRTGCFIVVLCIVLFFLSVFTITCTGNVKLTWRWYPPLNKTLFGIVVSTNWDTIDRISNSLSNIIQFTSFALIIGSTAVLVIQLKQKTKWREESTKSEAGRSLSTRDQKLSTMVISLAVIQIVSYIPVTVATFLMIYMPGFDVIGYRLNSFLISFSFSFLVDGINSSVSIFVYYKMSSKYRSTFCQIFCKTKVNFK